MKGYRGRLLRIDLSSSVVEDVEIAADELRIYGGGGALATALLMKLTSARCDALSADNPFILATGPATGAAVSGVSRCSAVALSPLTGAVGESQAGGMLGPAIKRAGYDALVLTGKARAPVWIELGDDGARIHEAGEIAELQSSEVFDELEDRLGGGWTILQCGPAGMRGVRHACLLAGRNDVFGRTGLGAVLGSKKVRAIAVNGSKKVEFADEAALKRLARAAAGRLAGASFPATLHAHGTPGVVEYQAEAGNLAARNPA
ncbi:MAG: aldehyde:ferredoxin oxidoreductase, partial [Deltaproteobacteria bacterium]